MPEPKLESKNSVEDLSSAPETHAELMDKEEDSELKQKRNFDRRKHNIGYVFDAFETGDERIEYILTKIVRPIEELGFVVYDKDIESLKECSHVSDRKHFIDAVVPILMPLWEYKRNLPNPEMKGVNKVLAYEIKNGTVELSFSTTGEKIFSIVRLFLEGLKDIAKAIEGDKSITEIWGDSQIIKEHPELLEKLGFSITDGKYVWSQRATISREEFLDRYFK
jgi:hypothetical protein